MKLVVVDVGNTSTAVGKWSGGRVTCVAHCDDGFAGASAKVRALASAGACAMAYLSVVPKADAAWRRFAKTLGLPFVPITHELFSPEPTPRRRLTATTRRWWCATSERRSQRQQSRQTACGAAA